MKILFACIFNGCLLLLIEFVVWVVVYCLTWLDDFDDCRETLQKGMRRWRFWLYVGGGLFGFAFIMTLSWKLG